MARNIFLYTTLEVMYIFNPVYNLKMLFENIRFNLKYFVVNITEPIILYNKSV